MNAVTLARTRTCIRCRTEFTESAGTVTRICDGCRNGGTGVHVGFRDGTVVNRSRERTCVRCNSTFVEGPGDVSRLCSACHPDHVMLE